MWQAVIWPARKIFQLFSEKKDEARLKLRDKRIGDKIKKIELPTPYSLFDVGTIMCNVYLILDPCLTLIDTSAKSTRALEVLTLAFSELGLTLQDLKRIIITPIRNGVWMNSIFWPWLGIKPGRLHL